MIQIFTKTSTGKPRLIQLSDHSKLGPEIEKLYARRIEAEAYCCERPSDPPEDHLIVGQVWREPSCFPMWRYSYDAQNGALIVGPEGGPSHG